MSKIKVLDLLLEQRNLVEIQFGYFWKDGSGKRTNSSYSLVFQVTQLYTVLGGDRVECQSIPITSNELGAFFSRIRFCLSIFCPFSHPRSCTRGCSLEFLI